MTRFEQLINSPLPIQNQLLELFDSEDNISIFDVGACEGEDTIRYRKLFPKSEILAFEPIAQNFANLNINTIKYNSTKYIGNMNYAISDCLANNKPMYVSEGHPDDTTSDGWNYGNKYSSLLAPEKILSLHKWCKFNKQESVKCITLDYFFEKKLTTEIDLLHLSVQGAEMMALKGLKNNISNVKVIYLDFALVELYKGQPLKKDIESFLYDKNFILMFSRANDISGDEILVNKDYFKQ